METKPRYLVMVTGLENHNKFYRMTPQPGTNTFLAEYGRVGAAHPQKKPYPMGSWDKIYNAKIKKGYVDQTDLHAVMIADANGQYAPEEDPEINTLIENLLNAANTTIKRNYVVTQDNVTLAMIDEAEKMLVKLDTAIHAEQRSYYSSIGYFNELLIKLFGIIPRKMKNVQDYLAKNEKEYADILERETILLETMKGMVDVSVRAKKRSSKQPTASGKKTYTQTNGLSIRKVTDNEMKQIVSHLNPLTRSKVGKCYYIRNNELDEAYNGYQKEGHTKKEVFLYHGSRNANILSIWNTGLKLKPPKNVTKAGHMWGYGIYSTDDSEKAFKYTSAPEAYWTRRVGDKTSTKGYILVFKVDIGRTLTTRTGHLKYCNYHYNDIVTDGYDSLSVLGGGEVLNNETIVFREEQLTPRYLIEVL